MGAALVPIATSVAGGLASSAGSGKGKGSTQSSTVDPAVAKNAAYAAAKAKDVARLGYQPNRGVTIAGFTPQQEAAMRGANQAAQAFGMPGVQGDPLAHMPATETSASGVQGYSTGADYDDMVSKLPAGFRKSLDGFFANPNKKMRYSKPAKVDTGGGGKGK